jgi:hypothetical protein
VHGFWPVEKSAELADGPTGCRDLGVYLLGISVRHVQLYFRDAEGRTRSNMLVAALVTRS